MGNLERYLQKKVVILHEDDLLQQAAHAMRENEVGCVLVCDHAGHLVGVLTDRDVVIRGVIQTLRQADEVRIGEVMSRDLITASPLDSLHSVLHLMQVHGIRRIPVVESDHSHSALCRGIITLDDLVLQRAVGIEQVSQIMRAQLIPSQAYRRSEGRLPENAQVEVDQFFDSLREAFGVSLDLSLSELEALSQLILKAMIQSLKRSTALQLLGELPTLFQSDLVLIANAPHQPVSGEFLIAEVERKFTVDEATARFMLSRFGERLGEWCQSRVLKHVLAQLPQDLLKLLSGQGFYKKAV